MNNTFVNDRTAGATFITVGSAIATPAFIANNIFFGPGTLTTQASAMQVANFAQGDPRLVDRAAYDYRLAPGSPCINAGTDPGTGAGFVLLPSRQYVHPAGAVDRTIEGDVDIGAYEFAHEGGAPRATLTSLALGLAARRRRTRGKKPTPGVPPPTSAAEERIYFQ